MLVAAGHFHSLWVKKDGTLKKLGANVTSQNKAYAKKIINKIEFDKEFEDYVLPLGRQIPVLSGSQKPLGVKDYFLFQNDLSGAETLSKDSLVGSTFPYAYDGIHYNALRDKWKDKTWVRQWQNTGLLTLWKNNYESFNENGKIPFFGIIGIDQDTETLYYKLGPIEKISAPYSPLAPVGRVLYSNEGEDPVDIWRVKGRGIKRDEYNKKSTSLTWTLKDKHYAPGYSYGYQLQTIRETKKHDYEIKVVLPTLKFTELEYYDKITDNQDDQDFIKKEELFTGLILPPRKIPKVKSEIFLWGIRGGMK